MGGVLKNAELEFHHLDLIFRDNPLIGYDLGKEFLKTYSHSVSASQEISVLQITSFCAFQLNMFKEAISLLSKAKIKCIENKNHSKLIEILNSIGASFRNMGSYSKAFEFYLNALKYAKIYSVVNYTTIVNLGALYDKMSYRDKAVEYFKIVVDRPKEENVPKIPLCTAYINLSNYYFDVSKYEECISNASNAIFHLKNMRYYNLEIPCIRNLGKAFIKIGKMKLGYQKINESMKMASKHGLNAEYIKSIIVIAELNLIAGRKKTSETLAKYALGVSQKKYPELQKNCLELVNRVFYQSRKFKESCKILKSLVSFKKKRVVLECRPDIISHKIYLNHLENQLIAHIRNEKKPLAKKNTNFIKLMIARLKVDEEFLFATLTAIQNLVLQGKRLIASDYLATFSQMSRIQLNLSERLFAAISEELSLANKYLHLIGLRYSAELSTKIILQENIDTSDQIPAYIIQPFIEESLKRINFSQHKKTDFTIFIKKVNYSYVLEIVVKNPLSLQPHKSGQMNFIRSNKNVSKECFGFDMTFQEKSIEQGHKLVLRMIKSQLTHPFKFQSNFLSENMA